MILCTVPPHILCRPNTVRYSLVLSVHDQRHRHSALSRTIKVSSPTLRRLCLPCITARNHPRPLSAKRPLAAAAGKTHQRRSVTTVDVAADIRSTTPLVHSSAYSQGNDANHSHESAHQQQPEISHSKEQSEEKDNEISLVKTETKSASSDDLGGDCVPLPSSSSSLTAAAAHDDDDAVGAAPREGRLI